MLCPLPPTGSVERAAPDLFAAADRTVRRCCDREATRPSGDPRTDRVGPLRPRLARAEVLGRLSVRAADFAAVPAELPAMASPAVTALATGDVHAVETVTPAQGIHTLIPAVKAAGARDILEPAITKIAE
jgi:ATP phosphoribosyltransferase-like protein